MVRLWNAHKIRHTKNCNMPCGRPIIMFNVPELFHTDDYLLPVSPEDIAACKRFCRKKPIVPCDSQLFRLANIIMEEKHLSMPTNANEATALYVVLKRELMEIS